MSILQLHPGSHEILLERHKSYSSLDKLSFIRAGGTQAVATRDNKESHAMVVVGGKERECCDFAVQAREY